MSEKKNLSVEKIEKIWRNLETIYAIEGMTFDDDEKVWGYRYLAGEIDIDEYVGHYLGADGQRYTPKTDAAQRKDREQLDMWQRISISEYFSLLMGLNKLVGVTRYAEINAADSCLSAIRACALLSSGYDGDFDAEFMCKVHEVMFGDIYYFAGKYRDVNMQLDSVTRFTPAKRLREETAKLFDGLRADGYYRGLDKKTFIAKLAEFMTVLNKLHPFREGNGRSKRVFLSLLAERAGWELNWSAVPAEHWKYSDECAFDSARDYGKADLTYLKQNLNAAISPKKP